MEERIKRLEEEIMYLIDRVQALEVIVENQKIGDNHVHYHFEQYGCVNPGDCEK